MQLRKTLTLACGLLASTAVLAARSDWRHMTVGHFHLYSTMRDSKTRDVARQLQAFEKTVGEILRTKDGLPDVPTVIYILDNGDFQQYGAGRPGSRATPNTGPSVWRQVADSADRQLPEQSEHRHIGTRCLRAGIPLRQEWP